MPYLYPFPEAGSGEQHPHNAPNQTTWNLMNLDVLNWTDSTVANAGVVFAPADAALSVPEQFVGIPVTHMKLLPIFEDASVAGTWVPVATPEEPSYFLSGINACAWTTTGQLPMQLVLSTDGASAIATGLSFVAILSDNQGICPGGP